MDDNFILILVPFREKGARKRERGMKAGGSLPVQFSGGVGRMKVMKSTEKESEGEGQWEGEEEGGRRREKPRTAEKERNSRKRLEKKKRFDLCEKTSSISYLLFIFWFQFVCEEKRIPLSYLFLSFS